MKNELACSKEKRHKFKPAWLYGLADRAYCIQISKQFWVEAGEFVKTRFPLAALYPIPSSRPTFDFATVPHAPRPLNFIIRYSSVRYSIFDIRCLIFIRP
jgi:hypothetical protein